MTNVNGSQFKSETVLGIAVKYQRRWERELKRTILRADGTAIGVVTRALSSSGDRYTYNGCNTFPRALEAIVRGIL